MDKYEYRFNPIKSQYELKRSEIRADFYSAKEVEKELDQKDEEIKRLRRELEESQSEFDFLSGGQSINEIFGREM